MVGHIDHAKRKAFTDPADREIDEPSGPLQHCPKCGGRTRMPCVYCRIVELIEKYPPKKSPRIGKSKHGDRPTSSDETNEIRIELNEKHRRRYEQIRAWRSAQPNPHFTDIPENWPWRNNEPLSPQPSKEPLL